MKRHVYSTFILNQYKNVIGSEKVVLCSESILRSNWAPETLRTDKSII